MAQLTPPLPTLPSANSFDPFAAVAIGDPWASTEPDLPGINRDCYERLLGLLRQLSLTPNIGALVSGDAGSGKTHLIKRFILSDEPFGCIYVNSLQDPAGMRSRLLDILVADLQNSRSNPQSTDLDSQIATQLREIIDRIAVIVGLTTEGIVPEGGELELTAFLNNPESAGVIEKIKTYLKRQQLRTAVERNFVEVVFRFLLDDFQDDASVYLSGGYLEPEVCERLGIRPMREFETVAAEEAHAFELLIAFGKLFRFGEPLLVCFDQLENLKSPELRGSFGQLVGDMVNQVPHILPVCFARPEFADEVLHRDLDQAVRERIFSNRIQIWGCDKDEARQLIIARQDWAREHAEETPTNLSESDIEVTLAKLKLAINSPRRILNAVQHEISEPDSQADPAEEISRIYLSELDKLMRAKPRNRKPCRPDALIAALSDYFEAQPQLPGGFVIEEADCENACQVAVVVLTPNGRKRRLAIRCDNRNYGPLLGKIFHGLSDRIDPEDEDQLVMFLRDGRKEIPERTHRYRAKKQFVAKGGIYVEFPYRWLAELYALDIVRQGIEARDLTYLTPDGASKTIREEDFRRYLRQTFRSSLADKILHTAQPDQSAIPDPADIDRQVVREEIEQFLNQAPFVFAFDAIRDHVRGIVPDAPDESVLDVLLSAKGRIKQLANNPPTFSLLSNV